MERLIFEAGLNLGLSEMDAMWDAIVDNLRNRLDALFETEGVIGGAPFAELLVTQNAAVPSTDVDVAPGSVYVLGEVGTVSAVTTLSHNGTPGTWYVKVAPATTLKGQGTISVTAATGDIVGVGTEFLKLNTEDRLEIDSGGANDGYYTVLTAPTDLAATVTPNFAVNENNIEDWYFVGRFAPGYGPSPADRVFQREESSNAAKVIFDMVGPVAGEVEIARVTVNLSGNTELITDRRSFNQLTLMTQLTDAGITDTYNIYASDNIQDHLDTVGEYAVANGAVTVDNPHGLGTSDIDVTDFGNDASHRWDWTMVPRNLGRFLGMILHEGIIQRYVPATELHVFGAAAHFDYAYSGPETAMTVRLPAGGAGADYCAGSSKLPYFPGVDWTVADNSRPAVHVLVSGDGVSPAGTVDLEFRATWVKPSVRVGESVAVAAVTLSASMFAAHRVVHDETFLGLVWDFTTNDKLALSDGVFDFTVRRLGTGTYAGPVYLSGVKFWAHHT